MLTRLGQVVLAGGIFAVGVLAVVTSFVGVPLSGVDVDEAGVQVVHVDPGSPAWRDDIREGQQVTFLGDAQDAVGWSIHTTDGATPRTSAAGAHLERVRRYGPWSALAT